jgi:hypothetical protein
MTIGEDHPTVTHAIIPELCDDETLHSLTSRWFLLSGTISRDRFFKSVFGKNVATFSFSHFSVYELDFLSRLPSDHSLCLDAKSLLRISVLPYSLYTLPATKREQIITSLISAHQNDDRRPWTTLQTVFKSRRRPVACPQCTDEDLRQFGFTWWRRSHQLPGIGRCHKHGCALVATCSQCNPKWTSLAMRLPEPSCDCKGKPETIVPEAAWTNETAGQLIAHVASQALKDPTPLDLSLLCTTLRGEVIRRYGASASAWHALGQELTDFAGPSYVSPTAKSPRLLSETFSRHACGVRKARLSVERYVLLIAFLFGDIDTLKRAALSETRVVEPVIISGATYQGDIVGSNIGVELRRLYVRHRGRISGMSRECGRPWTTVVRELATHCPDLIQPLRTSAKQKAVPVAKTLFAQGMELREIVRITGLSLSSIYKVCLSDPEARDARKRGLFTIRRERLRRKAKTLIDQGLKRSLITRKLGPSQKWLNTFDTQWIAENYPEKARGPGRKVVLSSSDWKKRDRHWAAVVPKVVNRLIEQQVHRMFQVKPSTVVRAMQLRHLVSRLPRTKAALEQYAESQASFRVRQAAHVARKLFKRMGRMPSAFAIANQIHRPLSELMPYLWLAGIDINSCTKQCEPSSSRQIMYYP